MALQWYVLRTKPKFEQMVARQLERMDLEVFFPCVATPQLERNSKAAPLFSGYLFVRFEMKIRSMEWLRALPGILGWVSFNGKVPSVPNDVIDELMRRVREINLDGGIWARFQPGDKVRVISGPLDSFGWVLEEPKSPQARVHVLLGFMERMVSAWVPHNSLKPAQEKLDANTSRLPGRRTRGRGRWIKGFSPPYAALETT